MPTAAQFREVAARLAEIHEEAVAMAADVDRVAEGAVIGGMVADRLARTRAETDAAMRRCGASLTVAAEVASIRAEQCRAYTAAMIRYRTERARREAELAEAPWLAAAPWPLPPPPPGPWAEEG